MALQSATSGFASIVALCLKSSVGLDSLCSRYQNAGTTIAALSSECTVVSAALTEMQMLLLQNSLVRNRPDLLDTFDDGLTGCMLLFTCLEQEIRKLSLPTSGGQLKIPWISKAKIVWNEGTMKDYLSQIRAQQATLLFLIQLLQLQSMDEIHRKLQENRLFLQQQETRTQSLRMSNPQVHVPESVLGIKRSADTIFRDDSSTLAASEFEFDDVLVNSKSYRRTLAIAQEALSKIDLNKVPDAPRGADPPEPRVLKWQASVTVMCLEIDRVELAFKAPFNRQQSQHLRLHNPNTGPVIFKALTTSPMGYYVRPSRGRIEAGQEFQLLIIKEPMKQEPSPEEKCRDKFLFQSFAVAADEQFDSHALISERIDNLLSVPSTKRLIQEKKIAVVFLPPDDPTITPIWY